MNYSELSSNQLRVSIDLRKTYEAYREARRNAARYAGGLTWKDVGGHEYLIKVINRRGGTKSLGPRSSETEGVTPNSWRARPVPRNVKPRWSGR